MDASPFREVADHTYAILGKRDDSGNPFHRRDRL